VDTIHLIVSSTAAFTVISFFIEELTRGILSARKQAYGKVIRMMSHEINNSVGAVNSILQSALDCAPRLALEDKQDFVHTIQVAIDRNMGSTYSWPTSRMSSASCRR
jgi:signal transduction histidine kinase